MLSLIACGTRKNEETIKNNVDSSEYNPTDANMTEESSQESGFQANGDKVLVDSVNFNDYKFKLYRIANPDKGEFAVDSLTFLLGYKGNQKIIDINTEFPYLEMLFKAKDINGNGIPDLVISDFSGGAHCCFNLKIYELGKDFRMLLELSGDAEPRLKDLNNDGIYEVEHATSIFAYWHACFAESYLASYVLTYKDGKYRLASEFMKKNPPDERTLKSKAAHIKLSNKPWDSEDGDFFEDPNLFEEMLELIFTGNMKTAWRLVDMAWPATKPGKEQFKKDFLNQLATFPYWEDLQKMQE